MGMTTSEDAGPPTRLGARPVWRLDRYVRQLGWASLVMNIVLVVTGGAVRLTASGLGCPTWPDCHAGSLTPRGELNIHSAIEFGNRMLVFVLAAVVVLAFVAAWQTRRRELRIIAGVVALSIPLQAVIGGISVLTDLNPWVVSLHMISSMAIIAVAVLFLWRIDGRLPRPAVLGWALYVAAWLVLYAGTVVTGSGPHAGNTASARNGLSPEQMAQLHADLVFAFTGLAVALYIASRGTRAHRPALLLLAVTAGQGVVGFVQYFTHLPIGLVDLHMFGAAVLIASVTWVLLASSRIPSLFGRRDAP